MCDFHKGAVPFCLIDRWYVFSKTARSLENRAGIFILHASFYLVPSSRFEATFRICLQSTKGEFSQKFKNSKNPKKFKNSHTNSNQSPNQTRTSHPILELSKQSPQQPTRSCSCLVFRLPIQLVKWHKTTNKRAAAPRAFSLKRLGFLFQTLFFVCFAFTFTHSPPLLTEKPNDFKYPSSLTPLSQLQLSPYIFCVSDAGFIKQVIFFSLHQRRCVCRKSV